MSENVEALDQNAARASISRAQNHDQFMEVAPIASGLATEENPWVTDSSSQDFSDDDGAPGDASLQDENILDEESLTGALSAVSHPGDTSSRRTGTERDQKARLEHSASDASISSSAIRALQPAGDGHGVTPLRMGPSLPMSSPPTND